MVELYCFDLNGAQRGGGGGGALSICLESCQQENCTRKHLILAMIGEQTPCHVLCNRLSEFSIRSID